MRRFNARTSSMRQQIWQAMRILRRFTVPDLCRTVDGATVANCQSFISRLYQEDYVNKFGMVRRGYPGEYQGYELTNDIGPVMPVFLKGRHAKKETDRKKEDVSINHDVTSSGELLPLAVEEVSP